VAVAASTFSDRRRSRRARLNLRGRYLLSDGGEHPCHTIDVSTSGVAISAYLVAELGERIVAYIDELGRLEGVVARRGDGWFAIESTISRSRIERLAQKLAELSRERGDFSDASASLSRSVELRTEFGQSFIVRLADATRVGARVIANFQLLPGTRLTLDRRPGIVVREVADGFVVEYEGGVR
jgi:uncharacterized small protein (DUF1192 family)